MRWLPAVLPLAALSAWAGISAPGLPSPPPSARGAPVVPDDLLEAGRRWGLEAQKAALGPGPASGRFRFGVIGDSEPGRFAWQRVFSPGKDAFPRQLRAMQALSPAFILQLGDFVSLGRAERYRAHFRLMDKEVRVPFLPVIGNHDRSRPNGSADKALYAALLGPGDFHFDYGGWRFVGLDTSDRRLRPDQVEWLKAVLPEDGKCVLFTHVPPRFLKGRLEAPAAAGEEAPEASRGYVRDLLTAYFDENAEAFGTLMRERRVPRVYMGHLHAFGAARLGPTLYVLSGGGGSPLYPLPPGEPEKRLAHFLEAEVDGAGIRETVHELGGASYPLPDLSDGGEGP